MAIDLSCYVSKPVNEVENILKIVSAEHQELFSRKFLISFVSETNEIDKEIAADYKLKSQSDFLVSLNDKMVVHLIKEVARILKDAYGKENIIVLFNNEKLL